MIIHRLIARHLRQRDDPGFYELQARDAIDWIERAGVELQPGAAVLDLGCGHGVFGAELAKRGCHVVFADEANFLLPAIVAPVFRRINLDQDPLSALGAYDLVICSNVLEHLRAPARFFAQAGSLLRPSGKLYLSWTNWLSPWGGHEFSPFHYLGPRLGPWVYDRIRRRPRIHTPFENIFPTSIGGILRLIQRQGDLRLLRRAPRYYPELSGLLWVPILREFVAWNCALLLDRGGTRPRVS